MCIHVPYHLSVSVVHSNEEDETRASKPLLLGSGEHKVTETKTRAAVMALGTCTMWDVCILCLHVCVQCMYVCMYVCVHMCVYMYVCMYSVHWMCAVMCQHTLHMYYTCVYTLCVCVCVCVCVLCAVQLMCVCVYVYSICVWAFYSKWNVLHICLAPPLVNAVKLLFTFNMGCLCLTFIYTGMWDLESKSCPMPVYLL